MSRDPKIVQYKMHTSSMALVRENNVIRHWLIRVVEL